MLLKELNSYNWFSAGRGHYAQMAKTDTRAGYKARLVSPYIKTTGKCMELFYWIREERSDDRQPSPPSPTLLTVIAISEELIEDVLYTVSDLTAHFPRLYVPLLNGTYRIAVEGQRSVMRQFCALSLDDLTIMDCDLFGKKILTLRCHTLVSLFIMLLLSSFSFLTSIDVIMHTNRPKSKSK